MGCWRAPPLRLSPSNLIVMTRLFCDPTLLKQDLSGRSYLITGASKGLGLALTRQLLEQKGSVIALSRTPPPINHPHLEWHPIDLGDFPKLVDLCTSIQFQHPKLDGLINNAAVIPENRSLSSEGFECQWAINFLAPCLVTTILASSLKMGRIVHVSSSAHHWIHGRMSAIYWDDLQFQQRRYDKWCAYGQSKLALLLHAQFWNTKPHSPPIFCVNPGWVHTEIAPSMLGKVPKRLHPFLRPFLRRKGLNSEWEGLQPTLHCLLTPSLTVRDGGYFSQYGLDESTQMVQMGWPIQSPNPIVYDQLVQQRLWEHTYRELHPYLTFEQ